MYFYSCFHESKKQLEIYRKYINMLNTLCQEKNLTNEDRLWFLNICFAEYYVHGHRMKRKILEEMRLASFQLAKLGECSFFMTSFIIDMSFYNFFLDFRQWYTRILLLLHCVALAKWSQRRNTNWHAIFANLWWRNTIKVKDN